MPAASYELTHPYGLNGKQAIDIPLEPKAILTEMAERSPRRIEDTWWYHPVQIDVDLAPDEFPADPFHRQFLNDISSSLVNQTDRDGNHHAVFANSLSDHEYAKKSDFILSFYDIPEGEGDLFERVPEVEPPLVLAASEKYKYGDGKDEKFPALGKNYTVVVTMKEDIAKMPKREAERIVRMLMVRIGAMKVIMIHPNSDRSDIDYYALGTMEGGLAVEYANKKGAIDRFVDRIVTHACARESGSFVKKPNVVDKIQWDKSYMPEHIAKASRLLSDWGYIDKPFPIRSVTKTDRRAMAINVIMGYSRQSESAIAAYDRSITVAQEYQMGNATGVIISSMSGRFNVDKTELQANNTIPVAIVPKDDYHPGTDDPLSLYGFDRYSLGIQGAGENVAGPSIEFDEMAAAILNSGFIRVRRHSSGHGFQLDMENGDIWLPRVRGFVHMHQGIDTILPEKIDKLNGRTARQLSEYVKANLADYPYPVGCGKDIMFACSTDAAARSNGVNTIGSGIQVAFFDAMDHGTNALLLAEPVPGTDGYIPENPFEPLLELVDPKNRAIVLSDELAMV